MSKELIISVNHEDLNEQAKEYLVWLWEKGPRSLTPEQQDKYHTQLGLLIGFIEFVKERNR